MKKTTWICVADATHLRILHSSGPNTAVERVTVEWHARDRDKDYADRPGRAFECADGTRHAMDKGDTPARRDKRGAATEVGERLSAHAAKGDYDRLILVAPPQFIGDVRKALNEAAADRVIVQVDKDLTHDTDGAIRKRLARIAPV